MKSQNGFSLTELLVAILVSSIVILAAGGLSKISLNSFYKELSKQETYNDLSYGLKLIRHRFRNSESSSIRKNVSASNAWEGQTLLEIGQEAFGIYKPDQSSKREFVYLADKSNVNNREVILTVPDGNIAWTVTCDPSCLNPRAMTVVFQGSKKNNSFHMETTIARRNSG